MPIWNVSEWHMFQNGIQHKHKFKSKTHVHRALGSNPYIHHFGQGSIFMTRERMTIMDSQDGQLPNSSQSPAYTSTEDNHKQVPIYKHINTPTNTKPVTVPRGGAWGGICPYPPPTRRGSSPSQKKKWQKSATFHKFFDFCPLRNAFCPLNALLKKTNKQKQKKILVPPLLQIHSKHVTILLFTCF